MTSASANVPREAPRLRHCLALAAPFVAVIFLTLPARFEENDDPVMLLIASGGLSGMPDAHLVFINYAYGLALTALYERLPNVEWYTWLFLVIHAIGFAVLLSGILRRRAQVPAPATLLLVALFCAIETRLLLHLQFTTTAALASTAGASLVFQPKFPHRMLGLALLLVGSLIRFEAFVLVVLILSPMLLMQLIRALREGNAAVPVGIMLLTMTSVLAMRYVDYAAYEQSSEWRDYREYNELRGRLNDNPNAGRMVNALPEGLSPNDYRLLRKFLPNTMAIDLPALRSIVGMTHELRVTDKAQHVLPQLSKHRAQLLATFCLVASLLVASRGTPDARLLLMAMAISASLLLLVSLDATLKARVMISATLPLLYVCAQSWRPALDHWRSTSAVAVCIALLIGLQTAAIAGAMTENSRGRDQFASQHALLSDYLSQPMKHVVPFRRDYLVEAQHPLDVSANHFKGQIRWRGWLSRYPLDADPGESFRVFVDGGGLFLRRGSDAVLPQIAESIKDSYGIQLIPRTVTSSDKYLIVEFQRN